MAGGKPRRLRWRLTVPLAAAFAALWLGTMALFTAKTQDNLKSTVTRQIQRVHDYIDMQWEYYENNTVKGLGAEAANILRSNISGYTTLLTNLHEGGMAVWLQDGEGTMIRSQLAGGYGHVEGVDEGQRWYLEFDSGLDDSGQLALAQWIQDHRRGDYAYVLYPADSWYADAAVQDEVPDMWALCDGTYARVTGLEQPGYSIAVQKIELIHPDGSVETMVETNTQGADPIVLDLSFLHASSVLLPSYGSSGDGKIDRELRLANFREAQAILEREMSSETGQGVVITSGGQLNGSRGGPGNTTSLVASQCDVLAATLEQEFRFYLSTFALLILVVLLLSKRLSKQVTAPVEALSREVQGGRCQTDGPVSELNALARAFNAAQDQLAGQLERERTFTRSAAHELKTPLAVLRAHGEALREDIRPEKRAEYLEILLDECDRMSGLVGSLLELSRLESGAALRREPVELSALVREVWEPLALPLDQKQISLTLALEEVRLEGDRARLREAAGNLASNALRHCPPGGHIQVVLEAAEGQARLTVCNDGPPIPEEDLPRLFEPFYRGDKSRSRESGGTGLGLAIVRAAVLAHGGRCGAENRPGGAAFWLTLPQQLQEDPKPL